MIAGSGRLGGTLSGDFGPANSVEAMGNLLALQQIPRHTGVWAILAPTRRLTYWKPKPERLVAGEQLPDRVSQEAFRDNHRGRERFEFT